MNFIVLSDNLYLKKGLQYRYALGNKTAIPHFPKMKLVIYDRGDEYLSIIPLALMPMLLHDENSFFRFISYNFVTYNKNTAMKNFEQCIRNAMNDNGRVKKKTLTEEECKTLNLMIQCANITKISQQLGNLNIKTIYGRKYRILDKLGMQSISQLIRIKKQWELYFR